MQIRVLALVALSATAETAAAGRLVAIRPAGDAEASVIELVGDRPLSFTTLRLASPPRVVVDVADADPSGVAAAQVIDDGTVRRVAVAPVGTTARVVIELAGETEFNVGAVGSVVQVRVSRLAPLVAKVAPRQVPPSAARPDGPPARVAEPLPERRVALAPVQEVSPSAATPPPPAPPAPAPTAPAPTSAPAEQRQAAPIAIAAAPTVVVPPAGEAPAPGRAPAPAAGPAQPPPVRAEPPPVALEQQARAEKPRTPPPQAPPSPEPAAAPRATPPAAVAQTSPPAAIREAAPTPAPARVQPPPAAPPAREPPREIAAERPPEIAPERPREIAAERPPEIAPERPREIAAERPPAPPKPPPQAIARAEPAAAPKPPPERRVARAERTASREDVERARASIPTVSIVASPPPVAAAPAPATAPARPAPARTRASITGIGFRPSAGGMVLVRSDRPLEYAVTGEGRVVVVHLRGAGIPLPTNRLPLDTRFFDTPVLRVVPEPVAGGIDLRIELRGQTRYELSQASGLLTIAFERS